jgi:hypothetical protein
MGKSGCCPAGSPDGERQERTNPACRAQALLDRGYGRVRPETEPQSSEMDEASKRILALMEASGRAEGLLPNRKLSEEDNDSPLFLGKKEAKS